MIKRYIVDEDLILKEYLKKIGIFSLIYPKNPFIKYSKRNKKIEWSIFSKRSDG